jgi:hypothetical protein
MKASGAGSTFAAPIAAMGPSPRRHRCAARCVAAMSGSSQRGISSQRRLTTEGQDSAAEVEGNLPSPARNEEPSGRS